MKIGSKITDLPNGAHFYRADLHIHSFGASHDVRDANMTPERIVAQALTEELQVIAITDHNSIANVDAAIQAAVAQGGKVYVVPGVELSTSHGHLLCYLPDLPALQKFFSHLEILDPTKQTSRPRQTMQECLDLLEKFGGFGVLAHIDIDDGFEVITVGNAPHKEDIVCHSALLGIEVTDVQSAFSYSDMDTDANRAQIGKARIERLKLGSKQFLARLLNSDAHTLKTIGKNAAGKQKMTRIKMNQPSFSALRLALEDSDARVRLEDLVPTSIPRILGISMAGGFLDGASIHFSHNLNCIIGGRGTGKTLAFEALGCLAGLQTTNDIVDSENWPAEITLYWEDEVGQCHTLVRPIGSPIANADDPLNGPLTFRIESFEQGETQAISKDAHKSPLALLSYLDRFVDVSEASVAENEARDELGRLQEQIDEVAKDVAAIPDKKRLLSTTQEQIKALKQKNAVEVIELQQKLEQERAVQNEISERVKEIGEGLDEHGDNILDEITGLAAPKDLVVGRVEFEGIVAAAKEFQGVTANVQKQKEVGFKTFKEASRDHLAAWKTKEADALKTIEEKRKELAALHIPLDLTTIQRITKNEAKLKVELTRLEKTPARLALLERKYATASKKRWQARERIASIRDAYARAASATLKTALKDLFVSLKFMRSAYAPSAANQIKQVMGWNTNQVPRATVLIEHLSMPGLLQAIDKKDTATIMSVESDGNKVFTKADTTELIKRLSDPAVRPILEVSEVYDIPRLTVTKMDAGGKPIHKDFSKLSLGQQQSVLLALVLSSKSSAPLIIDQPEDNLDGEFIYHSLVPVLRMAKEKRQIIIITHNANVAVLGDAEQIIVLKSTRDKGSIVSRGSIDDTDTRTAACNILEGAEEAFRRRAKTYGI